MTKTEWEKAAAADNTGSKFHEDGTKITCKPCSDRCGLNGCVFVKARRPYDPYRWKEHITTKGHIKNMAPLPAGVAIGAKPQGKLLRNFSFEQTFQKRSAESRGDDLPGSPASKKAARTRLKRPPGHCCGIVPPSKSYQNELAIYFKYCEIAPASQYCLRYDNDDWWLVVSKKCQVSKGLPRGNGLACCDECFQMTKKWAGIQKIISKQYLKFTRIQDALKVANKYLTYKHVNSALNRKMEEETVGYLKGLTATEDTYLSSEGKTLKAQCISVLGFYATAVKLKERIISRNSGKKHYESYESRMARTAAAAAADAVVVDETVEDAFPKQDKVEPPTLKNDGISVTKNHLPRSQSVQEIYDTAKRSQHVVIASSAATGKTSLLQLLEKKLEEDKTANIVQINLNGDFTSKALLDQLKFEGIDYEYSRVLRQIKNTWLLLDDAQNAYDPKFDPFWHFVIKGIASAKVEQELFVIVAATHDLSTPESPADFRGLEHINPHVTKEEVMRLFTMHAEAGGYQMWAVFRETLLDLSKFTESQDYYHIGVVMAGIRMVADMRKPAPEKMTEERALVALRKEQFTGCLDRCFKLPNDLAEDFKDRLLDVITGDCDEDEIVVDEPALVPSIRTGLLTKGGMFSNMAAMWYYNRRCFPNRATQAPDSLNELLTRAVGLISSKRLKDAQVQGFPTASTFQHLFNEAMSLLLPLRNAIIPELNTLAAHLPRDSDGTGELDFYITGKLQWCIELLTNGEKNSTKRFDPANEPDDNPPHRKVEMSDYLVVDCRGPMVGRGYLPSESRCTLYFDQDFKYCWCHMRTEEQFRIELAN